MPGAMVGTTRFEKLLLEHMDAWLEWAPRMRAAHAEVRDNMAAIAVAIQRTGSASGKVPELLCEAALKKLHDLSLSETYALKY